MDPFHHIRVFLHAVRQDLRRLAATRAIVYGVAGLLALAAVLPLFAWAVAAHHSTTLAVLGLLATLVLLGAGLAWGFVRPARRWRSDSDVARYVGQKRPDIASDLLSSVELGAAHAQSGNGSVAARHSSGHVSGELVGALLDVTASRVGAIEPRSLTERRLRRAMIVCGLAAVLHAGLLVASSSALAEGWGLLLSPHDPRPFGDARISEQPLVGDIRLTLQYPKYTDRISTELPSSSGDFRALPGTVITLETIALIPALQARLVFESDNAESPEQSGIVLEIAGDGRSLHARFAVTEPARYRFLITSPNGDRQVEARARNIEIDPDEVPEVKLYTPGEEIDVASLKRIELAYTAEDDYGISKVELVWSGRGKPVRKELPRPEGSRRRAQGKFVWDLAEVSLEPGIQVSYHLEVSDNDTVLGPNVGRSRSFRLRVFSPREKHEQQIARQRELVEKMVRVLGARLTVAAEDVHAHGALQKATAELVVELGTLITALGSDELADDDLQRTLGDMRSRLDKHAKTEAALVARMHNRQARGAGGRQIAARLGEKDAAIITELEDDVILLANWLDRQQMENLLAISDEVKQHRDRLDQLFKEFQRTGSPDLLAEIEREMKFLQRGLSEMAQRRTGLADDVLDRFVNAEALQGDQSFDCMAEVRSLMKNDPVAAQERFEECMRVFGQAAEAMEEALRALRNDTFSEGERKFGELMDKLADLTQDQRDLAKGAAEVWESYAARADEMMREEARETRKNVAKILDKLRKQLGKVPEGGLTPFAAEELEIVEARLRDVDEMLADGDIAEALAMATQARTGLETIAAELDAAMEDEQDEPWSEPTVLARREVKRAVPLARRLVAELEARAPSPREIMTRQDRKKLERLRRRQRSTAERARRLAERARQMAGDLPGRAGEAISRGISEAGQHMKRATERMRERDPSGARQETRGAAEALEQTLDSGRDAARRRQAFGRAGLRDEPVRIPGANEYRAPQEFREDILEAMKREEAPQGFGELVKRYYEELIR